MSVRIFFLYQLWKQLTALLLLILSLDQCILISWIASLFHFFWADQFTKWLFTHFFYLLESLRWSGRRRDFSYPTSAHFIFISTNWRSVPFYGFMFLVWKISCWNPLIFQHYIFSRLKISYHVSVLIRSQFYIVVDLEFNLLLYSKQQIILIVNLCKVFML